MSYLSTMTAGFTLGLSLIAAIGSQNAFILKQGIKGNHIFAICIVCALSDAILISFGVAGFGFIINKFPLIETIAKFAGATFLIAYGTINFRSAFTSDHSLKAQGDSSLSLTKTISLCLAFTWLNPHVYLDTIVLLGSISTQYAPLEFYFALGAISASLIFFFSLGYGAKKLSPIFANTNAWKILEIFVGMTMYTIAIALLFNT